MNRHPVGWKLELFLLGRLSLPESPAVVRMEEHLLMCHHCIDRAEKLLEFSQAMKTALIEEHPVPCP
jgi:hypothetical protein